MANKTQSPGRAAKKNPIGSVIYGSRADRCQRRSKSEPVATGWDLADFSTVADNRATCAFGLVGVQPTKEVNDLAGRNTA